MRKSQMIFLVITFVCLLTIISIPEFIKSLTPNEHLETKKIKGGGIEYRLTQGNFHIGNDIPEGYYDVTSDGDNYFNGTELSDGDHFLGLRLYDSNIAQVTGKGTIKLKKSAFSPVSKEGDSYEIHHSGFYTVGKQIQAGEYIITYETRNDEVLKEDPWFQIISDDLQKIIGGDSFGDANQFEVDLKENTWLELNQSGFSTNKNVSFFLRPVK
ncbi:hypothetical protein [Peribacillus simplex]|nr:hypothetical protein [Peribacillus simplex]